MKKCDWAIAERADRALVQQKKQPRILFLRSGAQPGVIWGLTQKREASEKEALINYVRTFLFLEVEVENPKMASINLAL